MRWALSYRADPRALPLANRHYNRQSPDSPQFVPPGKCLVLLTDCAKALWVTSWPKAEYVKHEWAGAWMNSLFRNESGLLASELILEAASATRFTWGEPPTLGLVTFVDQDEVKPKKDPGYCYLMAGFERCGTTQGGLLAFRLPPGRFPEPAPPRGSQLSFLEAS